MKLTERIYKVGIMLLSVLVFWLGHLIFFEPTYAQIPENPSAKSFFSAKKELCRSHSEVHFIQMDYGIEYVPKKLSKREKLSLALTNVVLDSQ
jgi:hypothetical protein